MLMESVRLSDELPLLMARVPDANRAYRHKAAQLTGGNCVLHALKFRLGASL